mmetsp:Transcript_12361/g.53063  ORF Transcript_12361/g.53063 Transcript_12361/m.53063 type:complete len:298 (+) Transcript_12361:642-1535(+)
MFAGSPPATRWSNMFGKVCFVWLRFATHKCVGCEGLDSSKHTKPLMCTPYARMPSNEAAALSTKKTGGSPYEEFTGKSSERHPSMTPRLFRRANTGATAFERLVASFPAIAGSSVTNVFVSSIRCGFARSSAVVEAGSTSYSAEVFSACDSFVSSLRHSAKTPSPSFASSAANAGCINPTLSPATTSGTYFRATSAGVISLHSATRFANPGTRPAPGDLAREIPGSADAPETAMPRGARRRLGLGRAGERVWAAGTHDATMRTERVLRACAWCSAAAPCDGRRTSSGASGAGQRSVS